MSSIRFAVIVGEVFDDIAAPKPPHNPWFKRLLWWLVGTGVAAVLSHEITKHLP